MHKVLVVDDDESIRNCLSSLLENNGFWSVCADNGKDALDVFREEKPSAVIIDLKMPGMDSIEVMRRVKEIDKETHVIVLTAYNDIEMAVETMRLGAYDFILKPPVFDKLVFTVRRAIETFDLSQTVRLLNNAMGVSLEWLLGKSDIIKTTIKQVNQVADSDFAIILQGETGTGKTTIARAIHHLSPRADNPFIVVDIGAIPETLVESELFGYEKGAFTGAEKRKEGFFEAADGGTIFIDELQNASPAIQCKILNAIENKTIFRLGNTKPINVDIRVIAASNIDIRKAVEEKKIREDLFYRLGEFIIDLPPLRERGDDIEFLSMRFFMEACSELNKHMESLLSKII